MSKSIFVSATAVLKAYISRTQPKRSLDSGSASMWAVKRSHSGATCTGHVVVIVLCVAFSCLTGARETGVIGGCQDLHEQYQYTKTRAAVPKAL